MSHHFLNGYSAAAASLFVIGASAALPCYAQQPSEQASYLEVSWMKVKQDKVAEFGDIARRIADANRRGKGDNWVAYADFYGTDQYVTIGSMRSSLDQIEPGMNKFMSSVKEMMGYTPERLFAETARLVESSGNELRRRRWDLSWGAKDDQDWMSRMAKAAYLSVVTIHVKPGRILDAEKQIMMLKEAATNKEGQNAVSVTQVMFGGSPATFYITSPLESVGDIAKLGSARTILGDEGYRTYSQMTVENYASVDYRVVRAVPAWSNPPASYVESNPKLWTVKPFATKQKAVSPENKPATTGGQ